MAAKLGGGEGGTEGGGKAIRLPSKKTVVALVTQCKVFDKEVKESSGSKGQVIGEAVQKKHLHKKAFAWAAMVNNMSPAKRAEYLAHVDRYREYLDLDRDKDQLDLGEDDAEGDGDGESDVRPRHMTQPGAAPDNVRQLATKAGAALPSDPDPKTKPH